MENLIQEIFNLKQHKEIIAANIEKLKAQLEQVTRVMDEKEATLLEKLSEAQLNECVCDDLVAFKQVRNNIGYTSDTDVVEILKSNFEGQYIRTKVTEALDKNALKKAIKSNETLQSALAPYIVNGTTENVIVTTLENRKRMLEHLENAKN